MNCPNCGGVTENGSAYCSFCGCAIPRDIPKYGAEQFNNAQQFNNAPPLFNPYAHQTTGGLEIDKLGSTAQTLSIIGLILFFLGLGIVSLILYIIAWENIKKARALNGGNKKFENTAVNAATATCIVLKCLIIAVASLIALLIIIGFTLGVYQSIEEARYRDNMRFARQFIFHYL